MFLLITSSTGQRDDTLLSFNWKFHLYDPDSQDLCPDDSFIPYNDMFCPNWAHQAAYHITADICRSGCCGDPNCAGWAFKADDTNIGTCVFGHDKYQCIQTDSSAGWVGGFRAVPASLIMPGPGGPHEVNYNDSSWRQVTIPHDYGLEQIRTPSSEMSHGYYPKNISWYRLHFDLATELAERTIWLEFEGVFRSSDMWLNGHYLGHHASGYTGFRWPVTKGNGAAFGSENVLAVRVDPFADEGWW